MVPRKFFEGATDVYKRQGFNFDIKWGDNGAYDQVIGTTLMDFDNMPMIITCGGSMNGTIVYAAEELSLIHISISWRFVCGFTEH